MKITIEKLEELAACPEGKDAFKEAYPKGVTLKILCKRCLKEDKFAWANWLIAHLLSPNNKARYAIYSAELVLHIFEKEYPEDNRPRKAIEATKTWLKNPTEKNKMAAHHAADAATDAAYAADAAYYATRADSGIKGKIINYGLTLIK